MRWPCHHSAGAKGIGKWLSEVDHQGQPEVLSLRKLLTSDELSANRIPPFRLKSSSPEGWGWQPIQARECHRMGENSRRDEPLLFPMGNVG